VKAFKHFNATSVDEAIALMRSFNGNANLIAGGTDLLGVLKDEILPDYPDAIINSKEAAYYFKIFREYHPQDSILGSIGIWTGFDFEEEREMVRGTVDGDLKHDY